jgi:hypothetical protein
MISLSYTMAKRYERCGELARQWHQKLVKDQVDQKPFFVGRVVHRAFEEFLTAETEQPLVSFLIGSWALEELALKDKPMALRWVEGERVLEFQRAADLLVALEGQTVGLRKLNWEPEKKYRCTITDDVAMYAKPDLFGMHPSAAVAYIVELKSGSTYDPEQCDWYAAVDSVSRKAEGRPALSYVAVALRPATETPVSTRAITADDMVKQVERAHRVASAMGRGEWVAVAQGFCSMCEGRDLCPDYQGRFGSVNRGQVSFSG